MTSLTTPKRSLSAGKEIESPRKKPNTSTKVYSTNPRAVKAMARRANLTPEQSAKRKARDAFLSRIRYAKAKRSKEPDWAGLSEEERALEMVNIKAMMKASEDDHSDDSEEDADPDPEVAFNILSEQAEQTLTAIKSLKDAFSRNDQRDKALKAQVLEQGDQVQTRDNNLVKAKVNLEEAKEDARKKGEAMQALEARLLEQENQVHKRDDHIAKLELKLEGAEEDARRQDECEASKIKDALTSKDQRLQALEAQVMKQGKRVQNQNDNIARLNIKLTEAENYARRMDESAASKIKDTLTQKDKRIQALDAQILERDIRVQKRDDNVAKLLVKLAAAEDDARRRDESEAGKIKDILRHFWSKEEVDGWKLSHNPWVKLTHAAQRMKSERKKLLEERDRQKELLKVSSEATQKVLDAMQGRTSF